MFNIIQSHTSKGVQGFSPPSASGSRALALRRWSVLGASRYYLTVKTLLNGLGRGNADDLCMLSASCRPTAHTTFNYTTAPYYGAQQLKGET